MAQRIRLQRATNSIKQQQYQRDRVQSQRATPWLKQRELTEPRLLPVDSRPGNPFEPQAFLVRDAFGRYVAL